MKLTESTLETVQEGVPTEQGVRGIGKGQTSWRWRKRVKTWKMKEGRGNIDSITGKGKSGTGDRSGLNIQLSSARNVSMNTSGGTFNMELKLAEMALLLL